MIEIKYSKIDVGDTFTVKGTEYMKTNYVRNLTDFNLLYNAVRMGSVHAGTFVRFRDDSKVLIEGQTKMTSKNKNKSTLCPPVQAPASLDAGKSAGGGVVMGEKND